MSNESEELTDMELFENFMEACVDVSKGGEEKQINQIMQITFYEMLQERNFSASLIEKGAALAIAKANGLNDESFELGVMSEVVATMIMNKSDSLKSSKDK